MNGTAERLEARETVVLVHGIWVNGLELALLARRLERCGFGTRRFDYHSVRRTPAENADRLAEFVRRLEVEQVHLVAHSLGGLLVLLLFHRHADLPPGRVLLLGSPVRGSGVARVVAGNRALRWLLGRSRKELVTGVPPWRGQRQLGVIAGTSPLGIGRLFGGLVGVNDGVVSLEETRVDGADAFMTVPLSHFGLVLSSRVADACCAFLRSGRFDREAQSSK